MERLLINFPSSFDILVKPNSSNTNIFFDEVSQKYRMNVAAKPEDGKANVEIIKFFKKEFKIDIQIIKGKTSKRKVLRVISDKCKRNV